MKRKILNFSKYVIVPAMFSVLVAVTGGANVFAADGDAFSANGLKYKILSENDKTVSVTGVENDSASLTVPASIVNGEATYTVTTIGEKAFKDNTSITSVTLNSNLTTIENLAFQNCTGLTSIIIPKTLTSADDTAFGQGVFHGCTNLSTITFEDGINTIPSCLFMNCTGIKELVLPDSITTIGGEAFSGCSSLAKITLSSNLKTIDTNAFLNCSSLTAIEFPKSLTTTDYDVFGGGPFRGCTNLTSVTFSFGMLKIPANIMDACSGIQTITIPDTITEIGDKAFNNCENLTSVVFSANITKIDDEAFMNCPKLTGITLPGRITYLGSNAFGKCASLETINIPLALAEINDDIFSGEGPFGGAGLKTVTFEAGRTSIPNDLFAGCTTLESITLPETLTQIGEDSFSGCTALTAITIPNTVTYIGPKAFSNSGLVEFIIPNSVTSLGMATVSGCTALDSITIPESITLIPVDFANSCTALTTVNFPAYSIEKIDNHAFANCTALTTINLPASLTYMGGNVFSKSGLTEITLPSQLRSMGTGTFQECSALTTVNLSAGLTEIPKDTFKGCTALTMADIPYRVTKIAENAFETCYSHTNISIPKSVTEIAANAFSYPGSLNINGVEGSYAQTFATNNTIKFTPASVETTSITLHNSRLLASDTMTVDKGGEYSIIAALAPITSTQEVTWTSSNPAAVYVDNNGMIKAIEGGTSVITATSGEASTSCTVVVEVPLEDLRLSNKTLTLTSIGATAALTVTKSPVAAIDTLTWVSSNPEVAAVDAEGKVTAISEGTATITVAGAKYTSVKDTCKVTVKNIVLSAPSVTAETEGTSVKLTWGAVDDATAYEIYRYDAASKEYKLMNRTANNLILTYTDTKPAEASNSYKVRAIFAADDAETIYGEFSKEQTVTIAPVTPVKPTAPARVTGLKQGSYSSVNITLKWNKLSGVTGYHIVKGTSKNGRYSTVANLNKNGSIYTALNIGTGKSYYFKVRAYKIVNGKKIYGDYSDAVKMATKPAASSVTAKKTGGTRVKITWTKSTGSNVYEVYMSTNKSKGFTKIKTVQSGRTLGFTKTGLTKGRTYYFKVRSYKINGSAKIYSGWSNVKGVRL